MCEYDYRWSGLRRSDPVAAQALVNQAEDVARQAGRISTSREISREVLSPLHPSVLDALTEWKLVIWKSTRQFVDSALQSGTICLPTHALVMDIRRAQGRVLPAEQAVGPAIR